MMQSMVGDTEQYQVNAIPNNLNGFFKENIVNSVKTLALVAALFASQSAMATTYDFGTMGPPDYKTITTTATTTAASFTDTFTFSINATANSAGNTTLNIFNPTADNILFVGLWNTDTGTSVSSVDYTPETFGFNDLVAGNYKMNFTARPTMAGFQYTVALTTTAVPEPEAYAMMLAGLGLVGFAARRKKSN